MTNLPPPGPESFRDPLGVNPSPPSPRRDSLGFKEALGVFIAFSTIGTILFWSLSRGKEVFDPGLPLASAPQPTSLPGIPLPVSPTPTEPQTVGPETVGPRVVGPQAVGPRAEGPQTVGPVRFSDVPEDFWAYPFITALSQRGVIGGFSDNTFRPNQPVTRAEFATFLQKAFDQDASTQTAQQFKDVSSDFWAAPAIGGATRAGFMQGYPGDIFRSSQRIPRVEALVALASGLNLPSSSTDQVLQTYEDANQIPNWATDKVAAATEAGLVVNYPEQKSLKPKEYATRADAAALIYQALVQAGQAESIKSDYLVQP